MEEKIKDENVRVVRNFRIASYLIKKGFKVVNIKKHREFICEITKLPCDFRTVFAFLIEDGFEEEYERAKQFYDEL